MGYLLVVLVFLVFSIIVDEMLFSTMSHEDPELYEKLGKPNHLSLAANPVTIYKYWIFILRGNPFAKGTTLYSRFEFSRIGFFSFLGSIALMVILALVNQIG